MQLGRVVAVRHDLVDHGHDSGDASAHPTDDVDHTAPVGRPGQRDDTAVDHDVERVRVDPQCTEQHLIADLREDLVVATQERAQEVGPGDHPDQAALVVHDR